MKEFFQVYPLAAWSIVSVMVAGLVIMILWQQLKLWWLNTWYSFPIIGKISRLSRDFNHDSSHPDWFKSERTLCGDYKKFIPTLDEQAFKEKKAYLRKADDVGRNDTPKLIWVLTIAMVFVEAMGFSYVLAGFTIPGASENTQQYGALGIAFLISVILVAFTHFSGHELFVSGKIKSARRKWIEKGKKHDFGSRGMDLESAQSGDDLEPDYSQLVNRVGDTESYKITVATIVFVLFVAVFSTYVRSTVLEQQLLLETTGKTAESSLAISSSSDGLDLSQASDISTLPAADIAEQQKAEQTADAEGVSNQRHGGWGTFVVLAFVFVFLQILGVIFGYRWGFAGKESRNAYRDTGSGRYSKYSDFLDYYQGVVDIAQAKLENLQQKLMDHNSKTGTSGKHTKKTFHDYMDEKKRPVNDDSKSATSQETKNKDSSITIEEVLLKVDALSDAQAKRDYMTTLPADLRSKAAEAIKQRKAEAAAKADAELDGLFD